MNIELVKLYNGDFIIGEVHAENVSEDALEMKNPRQVMMMPNMAGGMAVALKPVCFPFNCERLKENISLKSSQIMFIMTEDDLDKELVNGYKSEISGIKIASAADAAALAAASSKTSSKDFII